MASSIFGSAPTQYSFNVDSFKGIDLANSEVAVNKARSVDCVNIISDLAGKPVKRTGYETVGSVEGRINGIHRLKTAESETILVHAGTILYQWDKSAGTFTSVYTEMMDGRSMSYEHNGKLILIDGKKMLVYDGEVKTAESEATVPTVLTNATPNQEACGGSTVDDLNRLTPRRYVEYYATAEMITSTVKLYPPDSLGSGWVSVEKLTDEDEWEAVTYTKDSGGKYVSIASGQLTGLLTGEGKSNLRLGYEKALKDGTTEVINKAVCGKLYGVNGNTDRLFLSGTDNKVYYSDVDDLLNYPELNYVTVGADSSAVMGFSRINDSLGVHKEDNGQDASVFLITGTLNAQSAAVFSVKSGVNGAGAVSRYGFAEFAGEPVFVTANGLYAVTTQEITFEKYAEVRSFYVNPRLIAEDLREAVGCVYDNYYYLAVGDRCYVADGRQKVYESNAPMSTFQYEWYYWENVPARVWWQYEGHLYFGTDDGKIKRFYRAGEHSAAHNAYRDDDEAVAARWDTPYLYFDRMNHYKNLKNFAVMLAPYGRSGVKIYYRANGLREMVKQANADIFSFEDIDFERFTFNTDDAPMIVPTNWRLKKFMLVQFRFENDLAEPFGLYGFAGIYTVSSKYKG